MKPIVMVDASEYARLVDVQGWSLETKMALRLVGLAIGINEPTEEQIKRLFRIGILIEELKGDGQS